MKFFDGFVKWIDSLIDWWIDLFQVRVVAANRLVKQMLFRYQGHIGTYLIMGGVSHSFIGRLSLWGTFTRLLSPSVPFPAISSFCPLVSPFCPLDWWIEFWIYSLGRCYRASFVRDRRPRLDLRGSFCRHGVRNPRGHVGPRVQVGLIDWFMD